MNLLALSIDEGRRNAPLTVLHRPNWQWFPVEIGRLVNGLMTEAEQHPEHPEYVILWGAHTKEATLAALRGGVAFTATTHLGIDNPKLPWRPSFC